MLFAILQKYDFSSKSQPSAKNIETLSSCLRYCKSTIFQANHNGNGCITSSNTVVCDTAKVRFFKQITTAELSVSPKRPLFAILQKYDFSSKSQPTYIAISFLSVVCDTAKVRFFKQITTCYRSNRARRELFAILQKYDFSSKSQLLLLLFQLSYSCLRYCKSTIFQANHNC